MQLCVKLPAAVLVLIVAMLSAQWTARQAAPPLPIKFDGPPEGPVLFFVHGFPDDERLWDENVQHFVAQGYRCARVTMPNYASHPGIHEGLTWRAAGYNFDELVEMLKSAVERAGGGKPPVLVIHDWGALYGFYLVKKYPSIASAMVVLDVAMTDTINIGREPTFSNYGKMMDLGMKYQYMNIVLFFLCRVPGLAGLLRTTLPFDYINAYSYWHVHTDHLLHAALQLVGRKWLPAWQTAPFSGQFPPCPTLFVYGSAKGDFMFHDESFPQQLLSRTDGSDVLAMDAGHWVMSGKQFMPDAPKEFLDTILKPGRPEEFHQKADEFLANMRTTGVVLQ